MQQQYAEVLLPLPIQGTYTYHIPDSIGDLPIGSRVLVPFGRKKFYTAIVVLTHNRAPQGYEVKDLLSVLDSYPILRHPQLKFWSWIAEYYLCTIGEVYKAALPSGLKVESETFISPNPDFEESEAGQLSDREKVVLDFTAQRGRIQINEIAKATGFKCVESIVSKMLELNALHVSERIIDTYRPKTESFVRLTIDKGDNKGIASFFEMVKRAKKQEQLLLAYLDLSHWMQSGTATREVSKAELLKRSDCTQPVLAAAAQRGIFEIYKKEINRFDGLGSTLADPPALSPEQTVAYHEILESFKTHSITLLHGVTSSGKTSIYMHLISEELKLGKQTLLLVPEIALTTQLTFRLKKVFGNKLLIYHSKFSDNERVDIWKHLLRSNEPCVVIGVRSSVFLPFANLGLIIIDEEHDSSYKQQDPAPRYNGRNAALVLAMMHGAKTLLGSATPSVESYYNAEKGKYGLVTLSTRYEGIEMPTVKVIDTKLARKKHEMRGFFSQELITDCTQALNNGEQVILFQNRRGYSPLVRCKECGWVPKCVNCDVSLTYHKHLGTLSCHYCGYTISLPNICPACGNPAVEIVGYGTERIEDDVENVFPGKTILRMDLDTTRSKNGHEKIIEAFSKHKADILVGTQMVTKGLDFSGVNTVGILNADTMISFPDFRAHERAFDMLEQVAGRAGRANKQGNVVIQTSDPEHPIIEFVKNHDFIGFYRNELAERERFHYPPFTRIINIFLKHRDNNVVVEMAVRHADLLRRVFGERVLGPEAPMIARVQNMYIRQIVLKIETEASLSKVKQILRNIYERMLSLDSRMKSVRIHYDVDPS